MRIPAIPVAAIVLILLAPAARAQEHWTPVSKTALSITGPISIFRDHVRFGTGATLPLAAQGRRTEMEFDGQVMSVTIFRVTTPTDLVLLRDNALCGIGPATWIVTGASGGDRMLAVYTGAASPPENKSLCGTFRYELASR